MTTPHFSSPVRSKRLRNVTVTASLLMAACLIVVLASWLSADDSIAAARQAGPSGEALADLVTKLTAEKQLVGLAAMVVVDGEQQAAAACGERKIRSGILTQINDQWHLGSITKSITATMIARLIESGQMDWNETIGARFPDAPIHESWKTATLRQLLTHTSGAPANLSLALRFKQPAIGKESTQARRDAVMSILATEPLFKPGEKHAYSNVGYTIAGAMAEQATGQTWDELVRQHVFEPLELASAGFGPPTSSDENLEQPRGHRQILLMKTALDDKADNTFIIGPAGIVHMSLQDLCTYAQDHMQGEQGQGKLLSAESYKMLHTPELDNYACGWVKFETNKKIPSALYWHNGSNTMWYALVVFLPEKNMVVAVTSNDGDVPKAEAAAWQIVTWSVQELAK